MSGQLPGGMRPLAAPPTATKASWFTPKRIAILGGMVIGITAMMAWIVLTPRAPKPEPSRPPAKTQTAAYDPPAAITPVASKPTAPPPLPPVQPFIHPQQLPQAQPMAMPVIPPKRPAVLTFNGGAGNNVPDYMKPKEPTAEAHPASATATAIAYKPAVLPGAKTMTIPDRNLLLMPGPIICQMDTAINTDVAGPFQCHLDRDAVSPTGVVLMEKGTNILGGYASQVTQGQSRIIGITAFATTPNGVVVPLGGPLADQIGASGVEGNVDNHWMQRLGGALLLSLIDGAFALAQTELQKAGSTNLNISTGSGVSGLASQLLAKTINIPPTITIPQGTTVALWNTGFIDFNPSYKLEMAR